MGWLQIRLHLKELFASKIDAAEGGTGRDRKMSSSSTGSMKSKWLKAFKSLKTPTSSSNGPPTKEGEKKNGRDGGMNLGMETSTLAHQFQEYTYKKITPCDVCSQVLRGHTRQGLKCRVCKLNVHIDCQEKVGKCQAKSRLLRRQKSTSEIETRVTAAQEEEALTLSVNNPGRSSVSPTGSSSPRTVTWKTPPSRSLVTPTDQGTPPGEVDAIYQVLKQAGEISTNRTINPRNSELIPARRAQQPPLMLRGNTTLNVGPTPHASSSDYGAPTSLPTTEIARKRRMFGGLRSFSIFGRTNPPQGRSISLPEKSSQAQYAAGTRPFGQPLVLGSNHENGSASTNPSPKLSNKRSTKKRT